MARQRQKKQTLEDIYPADRRGLEAARDALFDLQTTYREGWHKLLEDQKTLKLGGELNRQRKVLIELNLQIVKMKERIAKIRKELAPEEDLTLL